jgi:FixJ family two-component response regulator
MTARDEIVFIVDDDERICEGLTELLASHGMQALAFRSAGEYMTADKPDLQSEMAQGDHPPIVFITGHGDIPSSVRAIKHGALDFLTKPFSEEAVMSAIRKGRSCRYRTVERTLSESDAPRARCSSAGGKRPPEQASRC